MDSDEKLTRTEFEEVIRRAAELSASDSEAAEGGLSETELYRIAAEVNLPERHVRRALAELRTGPSSRGPLDRIFGPSEVGASRVVPVGAQKVASQLDDFLVASQLLQAVRRGPEVLQYRPSVDWASQIARAASSTSRRYYVASARQVEIHLEPVSDESTMVRMQVDPGTRSDYLTGSAIGGSLGGVGVGVGMTLLLASAVPVWAAIGAGAVTASIFFLGMGKITGYYSRRKVEEVRAEVEGVLDRLEAGESLEPPPPSWRRWVRRHFHGVARDVFGRNDDDDELY